MKPEDNKFHKGNGKDGKHYWLTPPKLMQDLQLEFDFDFDACPFPKPDDFDGLTNEWGQSTYVNPPFGSIMHEGKKKGPTAWMRKSILENQKGKRVVVVYPIDKWILMMIQAGAKISNLGDVKWTSTEDGKAGKGTGRHIAQFVLEPKNSMTTPLNTWISVKDAMPENKINVLIWMNGNYLPAHYNYQFDMWFDDYEFRPIHEGITFWMLLSKPTTKP